MNQQRHNVCGHDTRRSWTVARTAEEWAFGSSWSRMNKAKPGVPKGRLRSVPFATTGMGSPGRRISRQPLLGSQTGIRELGLRASYVKVSMVISLFVVVVVVFPRPIKRRLSQQSHPSAAPSITICARRRHLHPAYLRLDPLRAHSMALPDKPSEDPGQFMELDDDDEKAARRTSLSVGRLLARANAIPARIASRLFPESPAGGGGKSKGQQISEPVLVYSSNILGANPATRPTSASTAGFRDGRNSSYSERSVNPRTSGMSTNASVSPANFF